MQALLRLVRFIKPYRVWAILAPLAMMLEVAMDLLQPRLLQHVIDNGILPKNLGLVVNTGLMMVGFAVIGIFGGMACTVFAVRAAQGVGADLRRTTFAKVQSLSFGNLDTLESGTLITRLTNDVTQVQEMVMMFLRMMVRAPLLLVGSLIMAILTSPRLALLFLPIIPFVVVVMIWTINKTYPLYSKVQARLDALNIVLQENLSGVRVVKAFARSEFEEQRFGVANEALTDNNIAAARFSTVTMPLMMVALNAGVVATLWFGGKFVSDRQLEVGQIIAFVNYLTETLMSLMFVSMLVVRFSRAEASAQRIGEVLETAPQIQDRAGAAAEFQPRGRVAFENVSFRYEGEESGLVLRSVSLVAEAGQTVAILGATGSGKSTLVNLVPRFYDVTEGRVTIDGMDVRDVAQSALHRAVGVALQEAILFSGTIRDNIRYGLPDASEEEVVAAAKAAQADEFIQRLPDGYDTVIGQRGVNLSGGQKQRIAIARALLPRPAILILDDSTSAVDVRTEAAIQAEFAADHGSQTRLIVAQRISAAAGADKIIVLDNGQVVGQGSHNELLATNPVYREIYESQKQQEGIADGG